METVETMEPKLDDDPTPFGHKATRPDNSGAANGKCATSPLLIWAPATGQQCRVTRRWQLWRSLTSGLVALVLLALWHSLRKCGMGDRHKEGTSFRWADVPPSRSLTWHPCYYGQGQQVSGAGGLECARLDVPMDWLDPSDDDSSQRVVLAVIRLRATSRSPYRGPVFFNPGGPGGSGVWALRDHGRDLQAIVGEDYDIVSFDPRGVGASTPRIECWSSAQDRVLWDLQDVGVLDAHPGVLYDAFARAQALSRTCEENMDGERGILRHSSTASHARDMLEILTQMGKEKLRYWGFSYGTVLGGTFAAMYPDRVERMVSDGNVDYKEWYHVTEYINFLRDADKVMDAFYTHCHKAGPLRCGFYSATPDKIRERLDLLLARLRLHPVLVPSSLAEADVTIPELVTYSKVKRMLSTALYQPIYRFQRVASVLAALERGDGRPYHAYASLDQGDPIPFCSAETVPSNPGIEEDTPDTFPAVLCADALPFNYTPETFQTYAIALQNMSVAAGAVQGSTRLSCAGRTVRPKWRFPGPYSANTSFPILFVNNIADNVTPLVSARNNSAGFPGSVVLVQNSYGHTSLAAASSCTARWVRRYFREGILPGEGTVCEADGMPFGDAAFPAVPVSPNAREDQGLGRDRGVSRDNDGDSGNEVTMAVRKLSREARWGMGFGL